MLARMRDIILPAGSPAALGELRMEDFSGGALLAGRLIPAALA